MTDWTEVGLYELLERLKAAPSCSEHGREYLVICSSCGHKIWCSGNHQSNTELSDFWTPCHCNNDE